METEIKDMTITADESVARIATQTPGATREFEKLGIDYCCGGTRTLGEACAQANINLDEVLALLQRNAAAPSPAGERNWEKAPLSGLIAHINATHHVFVRSECPRIEALATKVVAAHAKNHPELFAVQEQFSALAEELRVHLMKEEQVLFPYLLRMEESIEAGQPVPPAMFGTVVNPIRMMMSEHDGAGEALRQLRSLTRGYEVPADACLSYRTLFAALQEFETDLHQHIHLENNILFPRAANMESGRK
jgi:regulator of cell morphogenesis and NO signaling